ncbi:nuclear transcription factor Y subunit gamma-like [Arctopsyche grandis]|uniref:nuclear transcription factor Y subunit gamma-like n=1 Tax=Arctopsyche grandis TaxID=121162 RepID=UPI00406D8C37
MSVCFVPAETIIPDEDAEEDSQGENTMAHLALAQFWKKVMEDMHKLNLDDFKQQVLPLARIKKIMKLDDEVKMISAEAPLLFAKAAEIFIHELTLRAWIHTEENKRRTLQKNDIGSAAAKSDQYDFLIDILPPDELKHTKPREEAPAKTSVSQDQVQYYLQLAQQHQAALQQPQAQTQQIQTQVSQPSSAPPQVVQVASASATHQQQSAVQIVQQIVTPNGEIQQIPFQLTQSQLNMIRMQMQGGSQPIIIHTTPVPAGQTQPIQVPQQQQQQTPHPVYLTQVMASPEGELTS